MFRWFFVFHVKYKVFFRERFRISFKMPSCAAVNCSNSSKKGFVMKYFPKDPSRRREWVIRMKRANWTPTQHSTLCEVHFAPEMFERVREDGKKKLKANAVPTIFSFTKPKPERKAPLQRKANSPKKAKLAFSETVELPAELAEPSTSEYCPDVNLVETLQSSPSKSCSSENTATTISPIQEVMPNSENAELLIKLRKYERLYSKEKRRALRYKKALRQAKRQLKRVPKQPNCTQCDQLAYLFNEDQLLALKKKNMRKSTKLMKWTNDTIIKSLKLKFICGGSGYSELLKQKYPLPSLRTLQRRLQNLKFDSGILHEVFSFLELKVEQFSSYEKDCVLVLDEMAITPGSTYDTSLKKYYGDVTLPDHTGTANHVLVFMLGGVNSRWKQVVAYYFTSDSVNGAVFKNIITDIFKKSEEIGLKILSITSDMGPSNQALWKSWEIGASRHSTVKNKIKHPLNEEEYVFIFADVPHLFKNIKSMLITNKIINLPDAIVSKYKLPSSHVMSAHISEVISHQQNHFFKLAPKLSEEDLLPSHFSKMKVSTSSNVVSHSVSSALKFLSENLQKPEYLTTAWFLDNVEKWFHLMTSRHPSAALSKFNEDVYVESITFLDDFINIFTYMEVGHKKIWKPCQTGVLISTRSMLEIQTYLLDQRSYEFVLTSRFSQDCLENLFSVLRSKQIVPNAVQVKNNLKSICVSQYLKNASRSSYEDDDRELLSGFLDSLKTKNPTYDEVVLPTKVIVPVFNLGNSELNSLYNISGYILKSIVKNSKLCPVCLSSAGSTRPIYKKFTKLTLIKRFKENSLYFVSEEVFYFFLEMESVFRKYFPIISTQNINLQEFYLKEMLNLNLNLPDCHKLKKKIVTRFISFRLKINSKKLKASALRHSSKTVAGNLL